MFKIVAVGGIHDGKALDVHGSFGDHVELYASRGGAERELFRINRSAKKGRYDRGVNFKIVEIPQEEAGRLYESVPVEIDDTTDDDWDAITKKQCREAFRLMVQILARAVPTESRDGVMQMSVPTELLFEIHPLVKAMTENREI